MTDTGLCEDGFIPPKAGYLSLGDWVEIGTLEELDGRQHEILKRELLKRMPWKKGPYKIFGHEIDSEWKSNLKWARILDQDIDLEGKVIADLGSHNGYFMFRMADHNPKRVVGFEPQSNLVETFHFLNSMAGLGNLTQVHGTLDLLTEYRTRFHVVFCLGVLYHLKDPVSALQLIYDSMKSGGELIVESASIPGELPLSLTPRNRYTQARGVWHVPTRSCLENWIHRAGFKQIECFYHQPLIPDEQCSTPWAPVKSLSDFLDPQNPDRTIEGYPAPWRVYLKAKKLRNI